MNAIERSIWTGLSRGLNLASISNCADWAEKFRVMGQPFPGPFGFDHHPWLYEVHTSTFDEDVSKKAAQTGFTEWAINLALYSIWRGYSTLYVLPTSSDASEFSAGRFDPALALSPQLASIFTDVNNVHMKQTINATLYVRGSKSKAKLKSIPTAVIVLDEVDEMDEAAVKLSESRQAGQLYTKNAKLSTPTVPGFGIDVHYELSTQADYHFKCPSCSQYISLDYPRNFKITADSLNDPNIDNSHYFCHLCEAILRHEDKINFLKHQHFGGTGKYIHQFGQRSIGGWSINQMYSMAHAGKPRTFARAALGAELNSVNKQEFMNSNMGKCWVGSDARLTEEDIRKNVRSGFFLGNHAHKGPRTMGIDVGIRLHVKIHEWEPIMDRVPYGYIPNDAYRPKLIYGEPLDQGTDDFRRVLQLFYEYGCMGLVIDAEPERREAARLCQKLNGLGYMCDYQFSQQGKQLNVDDKELSVKANRTVWMDQVLYRHREGKIVLPEDVSDEYIKHLKEPVRVRRQDKLGNQYGIYVNAGPDHDTHASVYSEIAFCIFFGDGEAENIIKL
jgi:Phage terminase large subunit (GpA)